MKKIALTSLLAVFVVSGANAAINDNPLYRPEAGKFVSETTVASHSEKTTNVALGQEFAYGVSDRLSVGVATTLSENNWFDNSQWGALAVNANYRVLDGNLWKIDVFGGYGVTPVWGDHESFLDEDETIYDWTVGAQAGYTSGNLTLAGHVIYDYLGSESFNWDEDGIHTLRAGVTGFLELNKNWGLLAGVEYNGFLDDEIENDGFWTGTFGVNYNIDDDMFVAGYITKTMEHTEAGKWDVTDGFGFGAKFGIQF
ncbi:MAG: hypothetical protein NC311_03820 [Muribaculaceae bacterium]|nr:hypothetical protein [Muribaculaceae bacterium]